METEKMSVNPDLHDLFVWIRISEHFISKDDSGAVISCSEMCFKETVKIFNKLSLPHQAVIIDQKLSPDDALPLSPRAKVAWGVAMMDCYERDIHNLKITKNKENEIINRAKSRKTTRKVLGDAGPLLAACLWCGMLAVSDFGQEWIYQLSTWSLCAVASWSGIKFWNNGLRHWLFPLGFIGVIFNPIAPIRFDKEEWIIVDWIAACVFAAYIRTVYIYHIRRIDE